MLWNGNARSLVMPTSVDVELDSLGMSIEYLGGFRSE